VPFSLVSHPPSHLVSAVSVLSAFPLIDRWIDTRYLVSTVEEDYVGIDRCPFGARKGAGDGFNDVHTTERGGYCRRGICPVFPFSLSVPRLFEKVGN